MANSALNAYPKIWASRVNYCLCAKIPEWGYINFTPFSPTTANTSNRPVSPSRFRICLFRCISSTLHPTDFPLTYSRTSVPSPMLSVCVNSARSSTTRVRRRDELLHRPVQLILHPPHQPPVAPHHHQAGGGTLNLSPENGCLRHQESPGETQKGREGTSELSHNLYLPVPLVGGSTHTLSGASSSEFGISASIFTRCRLPFFPLGTASNSKEVLVRKIVLPAVPGRV